MSNYDAINWNRVEDPIDKQVWERLTANFWLDTKVPISNDLGSWNKMTPDEKQVVKDVFGTLTLLDTYQGNLGVPPLKDLAETLHAKAVFSNIEFMEAFAGSTELLTEQGWKQINEVTGEDLVAQYDPDTNTSSFVHPKVVPSHVAEKTYTITSANGNAKQVVSPGHRVYFEEKLKKNNKCKEWKPAVSEAGQLKYVNLKSAHRRFRTAAPVADGEGMSVIDRLLVAINADGAFGGTQYTGEISGTIPCHFTLRKQRKIDRLQELALEAGWKLVEGTEQEDRHFWLSVPLEYAHDRNKTFNHWFNLAEKSGTWFREFCAELGLWDGHTLKGGNGVTFYTTRKEDSDFVVAAATLAGYRSRTTTRVDSRKEEFSDSYITNITYHKDTVSAQNVTVTETEGQQVYCVQVPTTFLITRNGNSPVISGNCVHAKSYSTIFSTLCSSQEIDEIFRKAQEDELLIQELNILRVLMYKHFEFAASVFLESFLFYSGFFAPLKFAAEGRLTNTADIIRLIMRDEGVHGYYSGYQQQRLYPLDEHDKQVLEDALLSLYNLELQRVERIYDQIGWTEEVKAYLRFNANRALANLAMEPVFSEDQTQIPAYIMSALDIGTGESHDFFSGSGASYIVGETEETEDEDWTW